MKPYGILADLHLHSWQAFSSVGADGINLRLRGLLNEVKRCADEVKLAGGDTLYIAGDVFHVRGSIAPSVLNPTMDELKAIVDAGIDIRIIPGNHDLESKSSDRLTSAVTALGSLGAVIAHASYVDFSRNVVVIPWIEKIDDLKAEIQKVWNENDCHGYDLILHAPIDGVISSLPDHGLSADWLASVGFRRVFAGHYHAHKDFGNGVYSIGALAHHSFSDIGTKAGFLIVGDEVRWMKSHLPEFVDVGDEADELAIELAVEGNFVRAKVTTSKMSEIEEMREWLKKCGAAGVVIQTVKTATASREGGVAASVTAGASLETSIADYVKTQSFPNAEQVAIECQKILAGV